MIPKRYFWLFDVLAMLVAFGLACALTPLIDRLLREGGPLWSPHLEFLDIPTNAGQVLPPLRVLVGIFLALAPAIIIALGALGNHRPVCDQSRARIVVGGFFAPFLGLAVAGLIMFGLKSAAWSRVLTFSFALLSGFFLAGYRIIVCSYMCSRQRHGAFARNLLLICRPDCLDSIIDQFAQSVSDQNYRLIGYLEADGESKDYHDAGGLGASVRRHAAQAHGLERGQESSTGNSVDGPVAIAGVADHGADCVGSVPTKGRISDPPRLQCLGGVVDLGDLLILKPIDKVVAILPQEDAKWLSHVIRTCDKLGSVLWIVPEALLVCESKAIRIWSLPGRFPLPGILLAPPHWDSDALFLKRVFDLVVASYLLVCVSPLLALIALIIKLSGPKLPVFYPWHVIGQNGQPFTGYKFRTMVSNADALKPALLKHNEMKGPVFKMTRDPRVTRFGWFLRKYSLNELPQLWSVLKGDMSLVGPRPAFPHELRCYEIWQKRRLSIKPGMTCLWQVNGRNAVSDFNDWVRMDLHYIDNWSFWLDIKILFKTVWVVFAGTGK